jgi:hypothetical protein
MYFRLTDAGSQSFIGPFRVATFPNPWSLYWYFNCPDGISGGLALAAWLSGGGPPVPVLGEGGAAGSGVIPASKAGTEDWRGVDLTTGRFCHWSVVVGPSP